MILGRYYLVLVVLCLSPIGLASEDPAGNAIDSMQSDETDDQNSAEAQMLIQGHCSGCHSLQIVTTQRGDAEYWTDTIRWMQRTQNLWLIPPEQEAKIIDYLASNYSEEEWGRRPNLPPGLSAEAYWQ